MLSLVKPIMNGSGASDYREIYTEERIIGRGNFGSAHLVKSKLDKKWYVAKKVLLAGLGLKERAAAQQEVISLIWPPFLGNQIWRKRLSF